MQFSTCKVSCVLAVKVMAFKIKNVLGLSHNIVLAKCHPSRLERFAFFGRFFRSQIGRQAGCQSATNRNTLLEFQRREINTQKTQNVIISSLRNSRLHIFLLY